MTRADKYSAGIAFVLIMVICGCSNGGSESSSSSTKPLIPPTGACESIQLADVEESLSAVISRAQLSGATCLLELSAGGQARVSIVNDVPAGGLPSLFDGAYTTLTRSSGEAAVATESVALDVRAAVRRGGIAAVVDLKLPAGSAMVPEDAAVDLAAAVVSRAPKTKDVAPTEPVRWCATLTRAGDLTESQILDGSDLLADVQTGNCSGEADDGVWSVVRIQAVGADSAALDAAGGAEAVSVEVAEGGRYVAGSRDATITGSLYVLDGGELYQVTGSGDLGQLDRLTAFAELAAA